MKKIYISALAALFSFGLFAGKSNMTGSATESAPAEFVTIAIKVQSNCYATGAQAASANDETVSSLMEALKGHLIDSEVDNVWTSGGYTSPYSTTIYIDNHSETVCQGTFQKSQTVTFKTANIEDISNVYTAIQDHVFTNLSDNSDGTSPVTYATMSRANGGICDMTRSALQSTARQSAIHDAIAKFTDYAEACNLEGQYEIIGFGEPNYTSSGSGRYYDHAELAPPASSVVQLTIDDIKVSASISVDFEFPNCHCTLACNDNDDE